jgi:osmotically-inducible protein OsmY
MKTKGEGKDMKVNTLLKAILCLVLIAAIAGCAGGPKKKSTGEYFDDAAITTRVKTAFIGDPTLKAMQIDVDTYKGIVQLNGFVDRAENIQKAAELARSVKGVRDVKNNLQVKPQ